MKHRLIAGVVVVSALGLLAGPAFAQCAGSCTVTFANADGDKIQDDGAGYQSCTGCVLVRISSGGQLWMRTVCGSSCSECGYLSGTCPNGLPPRSLTLDFTSPVGAPPASCTVDDAHGQTGTLDICGVNQVRDVRFVAASLFSSGKASTTVELHMNLVPDFSHTAFILEFEARVPFTGDASTRTLTANTQAIAELYKVSTTKGGGTKKVSLGRFYMPFSLTTVR
jgi:hypothetical protein